MTKSKYNIITQDDEVVVLQDLGPWTDHPTITNDIENVIEDLKDILNHRILRYVDSEGKITVAHYDQNYKFIGFN